MADDEYRTGPGRPPREHQFKKGQSGNKKGRPSGRRNITNALWEVLEAEVTQGNGEKITTLKALLKQQAHKALKGDLRAIENLLDRGERHSEPEAVTREERADEDDAILRRFRERDRDEEPEAA